MVLLSQASVSAGRGSVRELAGLRVWLSVVIGSVLSVNTQVHIAWRMVARQVRILVPERPRAHATQPGRIGDAYRLDTWNQKLAVAGCFRNSSVRCSRRRVYVDPTRLP